MKTFEKYCDELKENGGIFKNFYCIRYFKPSYIYHREDGPAKEWYDGDKDWCYNGKLIMDTKGDVTPEQVIDFKLRLL